MRYVDQRGFTTVRLEHSICYVKLLDTNILIAFDFSYHRFTVQIFLVNSSRVLLQVALIQLTPPELTFVNINAPPHTPGYPQHDLFTALITRTDHQESNSRAIKEGGSVHKLSKQVPMVTTSPWSPTWIVLKKFAHSLFRSWWLRVHHSLFYDIGGCKRRYPIYEYAYFSIFPIDRWWPTHIFATANFRCKYPVFCWPHVLFTLRMLGETHSDQCNIEMQQS